MSGGGFMSEGLRQWVGGNGWMAIAEFEGRGRGSSGGCMS